MDSNLGTTGRFEDRKISNRKSLCSCRKIFLSFPMIAAVGTRTPNPVAVKGQNARDVLPFQGDEPCIPGNPGRRFALPWALTLLPRSGRRTHAPRTKNQEPTSTHPQSFGTASPTNIFCVRTIWGDSTNQCQAEAIEDNRSTLFGTTKNKEPRTKNYSSSSNPSCS